MSRPRSSTGGSIASTDRARAPAASAARSMSVCRWSQAARCAWTGAASSGVSTSSTHNAAISSASALAKTGLTAHTKVGLMGYSGGAIASEWAAELAPTYAPGVAKRIVGTAIGGSFAWLIGQMRDASWTESIAMRLDATIYSLIIIAGFVFVVRMRDLIGADVFRNLLLGRYHRPTQEERLFLFVDVTGSTAYAESHGDLRAQEYLGAIFAAFGSSPEAQAASDVLLPALLPLYESVDPDNTGGAMLLGVDGLCLISHGSSSATAIVNAVRVAKELLDAGIVDRLRAAAAPV